MNGLPDRLDAIKSKLRSAKVYYSIPNRRSTYLMDVEDASEDVSWMIYEIERLRETTGAGEGVER